MQDAGPMEIRDARGGNRFFIDNDLLDDYAKVMGPVGLAVYAALARYANSQQTCYPSQAAIAAMLGLTRRWVGVKLAQLRELELISVEEREGHSSLYTLLRVKSLIDSERDGAQPANVVTRGCEPSSQVGANVVTRGCERSSQGCERSSQGVVTTLAGGGNYVSTEQDTKNKTHRTRHTEQEGEVVPPSSDGGSAAGWSEGERVYLEAFNRKRFTYPPQRQAVRALEEKFGLEVLKRGIEWAACKGIADLNAIAKCCERMAKDDKEGGTPNDSSNRAAKPKRVGSGKYAAYD